MHKLGSARYVARRAAMSLSKSVIQKWRIAGSAPRSHTDVPLVNTERRKLSSHSATAQIS